MTGKKARAELLRGPLVGFLVSLAETYGTEHEGISQMECSLDVLSIYALTTSFITRYL